MTLLYIDTLHSSVRLSTRRNVRLNTRRRTRRSVRQVTRSFALGTATRGSVRRSLRGAAPRFQSRSRSPIATRCPRSTVTRWGGQHFCLSLHCVFQVPVQHPVEKCEKVPKENCNKYPVDICDLVPVEKPIKVSKKVCHSHGSDHWSIFSS